MELRIGYFADGEWAHRSFEKLIEDRSIRILFICVRYDKQDPVLAEYAKEYGIDLLMDANINSPAFLAGLKEYQADLFVSMSFNQIFKKEILKLPRLGIINCHAGKLPFYRGRNILNWVLINDEPEFGITVHYVDEGIDTGDIICQRTYPITDEDDYSTLLKKAHTGCAEVLYQGIRELLEGRVRPLKQNSIDPVGMYCGMRGPGDERLCLHQTSREVFNFVRAICRPGPGARARIGDLEIIIHKVKMVAGARPYKCITGQVLGKTAQGFYLKTLDTMVEVVDYEYDGVIRVGDRLR